MSDAKEDFPTSGCVLGISLTLTLTLIGIYYTVYYHNVIGQPESERSWHFDVDMCMLIVLCILFGIATIVQITVLIDYLTEKKS